MLLTASLLVLSLASAEPPPRPAIAVFALAAEEGVSASIAKLVTDQVTQAFRQSGAFARVISSLEMEAIIPPERQQHLQSCDSVGCLVEFAGAIGVQHVTTGSIGRLGGSFVFTLRLVDVQKATVAGAISDRIVGTDAEVLLDAVPSAVSRILVDAGLAAAPPPPAPAPVAAAPAPAAPTVERSLPAAPAPPLPAPPDDDRGPSIPLLALGGGLVVLGALGVPPGLVLSFIGYLVAGTFFGVMARNRYVAEGTGLLAAGATTLIFVVVTGALALGGLAAIRNGL